MYTNFGNPNSAKQSASLLKRSSCILWGSIILIILSVLGTVVFLILFLVKGMSFGDILSGKSQITDDESNAKEELLNKITNQDFRDFSSNFKAVELPLKVVVSKINITDWPEMDNKYINAFLKGYSIIGDPNSGDCLVSGNPYCREEKNRTEEEKEFDEEFKKEFDKNLETVGGSKEEYRQPRYFVGVFKKENVLILLRIDKYYQDSMKRKNTYVTLSTFKHNGEHISSLMVGQAEDIGDNHTYQRFTIDENYKINIEEQEGRSYMPGQYSETFYGDSGQYEIKEDGSIVEVNTNKIERDEADDSASENSLNDNNDNGDEALEIEPIKRSR